MKLFSLLMNSYLLITQYSERAEAFVKRTILTLEKLNFTAEFNRETQEHYKSLLNAGCDNYAAAEDTIELEASLSNEYFELQNGMYAAVLVGFYHLWERDIRSLCKRLIRYYNAYNPSGKKVTEKKLQTFKFDDLKDFLTSFGMEAVAFRDMNLLRLVINTVKHSAGDSANELRLLDNEWYCKLSNMCDLDVDEFPSDTATTIYTEGIAIDDVKYFGAALNLFWANAVRSDRFKEMHF